MLWDERGCIEGDAAITKGLYCRWKVVFQRRRSGNMAWNFCLKFDCWLQLQHVGVVWSEIDVFQGWVWSLVTSGFEFFFFLKDYIYISCLISGRWTKRIVPYYLSSRCNIWKWCNTKTILPSLASELIMVCSIQYAYHRIFLHMNAEFWKKPFQLNYEIEYIVYDMNQQSLYTINQGVLNRQPYPHTVFWTFFCLFSFEWTSATSPF